MGPSQLLFGFDPVVEIAAVAASSLEEPEVGRFGNFLVAGHVRIRSIGERDRPIDRSLDRFTCGGPDRRRGIARGLPSRRAACSSWRSSWRGIRVTWGRVLLGH
jgi:hypothetical protein